MYSKILLSWVSTVGEIIHVFSCLPRLQIRCEHLLSLLVKSSLRWWEAALLCNFTSMTDCSQMAGKAGLWNLNISIEYIVWVIFFKNIFEIQGAQVMQWQVRFVRLSLPTGFKMMRTGQWASVLPTDLCTCTCIYPCEAFQILKYSTFLVIFSPPCCYVLLIAFL